MQTYGFKEGHGNKHKNTFDAFRTILRQDGFKGWFRGLSLNYVKAFPQVAISFTTYEFVQRHLTQWQHASSKTPTNSN